MKTTFMTTLLQAEGMNATGLRVPAEAVAALGSHKRPKVIVSLNGYTYRSTVASTTAPSTPMVAWMMTMP